MIYISQVQIPCQEEIIQLFKDNFLSTYVWDETRVLSMDRGGIGDKVKSDTYKKIYEIVKDVKRRVYHDNRFSVLRDSHFVKPLFCVSICNLNST